MDFVDADCIINEALLLACPDEFWRKITWHTNSPCDFYIASNPYLRPNRGATGTTVEGATAEERQGATSLRGMVKVVTTIPCSLRTFATFITSPRSVQYCEDNVIFCEAFEEDDKVKWVHIAYGGNSPSDVVAMHRTTVCQIMVPLTENSPMRRFVDSVWNEECGKLTQGALTSIFVSGLKSAAHPRVPISHQYTRRKIHLSAFIAYELPISGVRVTFVFAPNESFPNMIDWCAKKIMCIRNLCQMFEWLNSGGHLIPKQIQGSDERYEGLGGSPRSLPGGTRPVPSLEYQKAEALIQVNTSTLSERVFDTLFALQASDAWRLAFQYEGCTVEECKARHCFPAPAFLKAYRFTTTITATMETFRSLVDDPLQLHRYDNFVENTMLIEEQNEEKVFYAQFRELLPSAPKRDICVFLSKKMLQPHEAQQLRLYQSTDSSSAVYVQNSVQSTKSPLRKGYERQLVYAMGFVVIPTTTHPLADARGGAQGEGALRVHYIVSVDTNTTTLSAEIEVAAVQQYFTRLVGIRQLCEGNKRVNPEYTPPCLASSTVSQRGSSKRVTFIEVETLEDHQLEEISNVMDVRRYIYTDDSLDISHEQFDQQNPETFEAPSLDKFYSLLRVMPIITKRDDDNIIKMPVITCVDDLPQTETEEYNYTQVTPQEQTEEVHRSHENNNNILTTGDSDKGILVQAGQQLKVSSTKGTQQCEDGTTLAWGDNDKGILVQAGQQLKVSSTKGTQQCEDGTTLAWGDNDKGILVQAGQQLKGSSTKGTQQCEDGTTIAWGDSDKGILVQAGQQLKVSSTKGTQQCEDGTTLAWGDNDKGILVQAGQQLKGSSTKGTQPCEDGTTLAWGDNDKGILVQAGQQVKGSSTKGTQPCEDGTTLAWGDNDKGILVQAGQQLKSSSTKGTQPCEDGTTLAWGDNDKGILVQAGQQLKSSSTKGTQPCEDGTTIAWGDNDKGILVQAGQQVKSSSTKGTQPCEDGTTLAWGDNDKGILVQAGQQLKSSSTKGTQPCEDGTTIAWGDNDKGILVQAGQQLKVSSTKRTQPCEDGTTIAWGDNDKGILVQAGQQVKGSSTKGTQQCEDGTTIAWGDNDKGILVQAGQQLKVSFTENRKDKGSDPSGALLQIEGKIMADGQQGGAAKIKAIPWNSTTLPTNEGKSATEWPEIFSGGVQHDQRRVGELTLHPLHKEVRPQLTPFHGVHGSIELCVTQQEKTDAGKTQETVGEKFPLKADAPSSGVVKQPISLRGKAPRALRGMKRSEDQSLKKGLTSREAPREFVKGLKVWPTPDALKVRPRKGASVFAPQSDLHYTQEIRNKEWEEEVCAESLMQKGDEWFAIENVGAHGSVGDLGYSGRTISGMHRRETQQTVQLNVWRCRNMPATKTSPDSMLFIHVSTSFGQARTGLVPLVLNPIFPQHPILLDRPYDDTVSIVAIVKTSDGRMKRLGEAVISLRLLHVMQSYTRWVSLICNAGTSNAYECGDVCITLYREADKGCDNQLAGPTSNTGPQLLKWEEDERTEEEEELRRYIRDVLVTSGNENLHLLEWLVGFCFRRTPDEIDEFIRKYRKEDMVTLTIYEMSELRTEHGAPLLRSDPCYIVAETSRGLSRTPSMTVKEQGVSMNEAFHLVVGVNEVIRLIVFFGRMEIGETLIYAGREDCISTRLIVSRAGTAEAVPCGNITVGTRRSSVADIDNALEVPPLVTEEESEGMECLRHILWVNAPSSLHRLDVIASSQLEYNHYLEKFGPTLGWYDVRVTLKYWKPSSSVWDSPLVNEKAGRNSVGRREEALARHVRTTYRKIYAIINVGLEYHKTSLISVNRLGEAYLDEVIQVRGMIPGKDEVVVSIIGKSIEGMEDHDLGVVSLPLYSLKQLKPTHMTVPLVRDAGTIDACIKGSLYLELFAISCDGTPLNHFQAAICRPNMRSILYNHAPQQLHRVECFLGSYAGCEKEALVAMRERYGPDMLKTHMDIKVLTVNVREPVLNGYLKVHLNGSTVLRTGKLDNETFSNIGSSGVQNEVRVPINDIFDIRLVFKVKFTRYLMAKTHCKGEFNIRGAVVSQEGVYWIPLVNNQDMDAGEICVELRSSAFIVNSTVLKAPDDVETDVVSLLRRYRPSKIPLARSLIREATSRETAHAEILKEVVTNPVAVTLFLSVEHLSIHRSGLSLELGGDCEKQPEDETEYVVTANFGGDENSTISQNFTPQGNSCTIRLDVSPPQRGKAHQELTIAVQRRCATSSPMSHKKNHEAQPGKTFSLSLLRKRLFSGQKRSKNVQRPQQQTENVGCAVISLRALFTPLLYAPGEVVTVPLVHVPHRKEDENEVGWKVKENEKSSQKKWRPASTNQPSGCELVGYISFRVRLAAYEKPPSWMQFNPKTLERDNKVSRTVMRYYEECIHTILSEHMQQSLLDVHYRMYDRCVASGEWLQQLSGWKKSLLKQFPEARCSRDVSPTITPRPSTPPASRGSENTSESGTLKQSDHGISTDGCNIAESEVQSEKERKSELESESERKGEKESESGLGSESESRSRSELGGKKRSESESRSRSELGGKKGSESELRSRSGLSLGERRG
uniref:Uncharacterized protein TCIL3000_11_11660 n=1 Tax=Trypanosoma congolense (strain IL3000) TaxID=1068625 RepID=G0V203_TRYCI|nr:unnamed protein product [Trypanosoma congolense IL3000]